MKAAFSIVTILSVYTAMCSYASAQTSKTEQLIKENNALKLENEQLKKEIERLKKLTGTKNTAGDVNKSKSKISSDTAAKIDKPLIILFSDYTWPNSELSYAKELIKQGYAIYPVKYPGNPQSQQIANELAELSGTKVTQVTSNDSNSIQLQFYNPSDTILYLDATGSMIDRFDSVRRIVKSIITGLDEKKSFSIISSNKAIAPKALATKQNMSKANEVLSGIVPKGGDVILVDFILYARKYSQLKDHVLYSDFMNEIKKGKQKYSSHGNPVLEKQNTLKYKAWLAKYIMGKKVVLFDKITDMRIGRPNSLVLNEKYEVILPKTVASTLKRGQLLELINVYRPDHKKELAVASCMLVIGDKQYRMKIITPQGLFRQ